MKQGEIWMVDFGSPSGPEQAGVRPAIVVPLTTNLKRLLTQPTRLLYAGEGGFTHDSVVLCCQVQVRGKARLLSRLGVLSTARLIEVQEGVLNALGL